jgi:hypothetical protein
MTDTFARNLEARLTGAAPDGMQGTQTSFAAGALVWQVVAARLKKLFGRALRRSKP